MVSMWCTTPGRTFSRAKTSGRVRSGNSAISRWWTDPPIAVMMDTPSVVAAYPLDDNRVVVSRSRLFRGSTSGLYWLQKSMPMTGVSTSSTTKFHMKARLRHMVRCIAVIPYVAMCIPLTENRS